MSQQRTIAVVTGGSSNIGWACVRRFAGAHDVIVADLNPPAGPLPPGASWVRTDVTDEASCAALFASLPGPLAAVVHSAGITAPARPIAQIPLEEWRRLIDVNLTGGFVVAKAAIPPLRAARGAMVMIASRAGRAGVAALELTPAGTKAHYAASKAGLMSLVRSLALELAPDGVRVNAVLPGSIEGSMIPRERWPALAARIPLGRLGQPEEIAATAWQLCSPEASYVTGHALDVNGGTWMN